MVTKEVGETIKKLVDIYASKNGKKIQEELLKELQKVARTITHGDARGIISLNLRVMVAWE